MEGIIGILRSNSWLLIPMMALCIPIVAIVMGSIQSIVKMIIRHRERMTLIQQGLPPDHLGPADEPAAKWQNKVTTDR